MTPQILLVPGLVCDAHVWHAVLDRHPEARVADVTTQSSIDAMAQTILAETEGPLIVLGHSMGGRVAMQMAHLAPKRIAGLALLNTGMHPLRDGEPAKREAAIERAHAGGMAALAEAWLPGMMAQGMEPDPEVMQGLTEMVLRMTPEIHERQIRALMGRPNAEETIGAYTGPLLLLTGRQDIFSPIAQHEAIAALCPQGVLHIIENAGHFAPVEQPGATARVLSDWITSLT